MTDPDSFDRDWLVKDLEPAPRFRTAEDYRNATGEDDGYITFPPASGGLDLSQVKIIGLTGLRNVGKSTVADYLKAKGFQSVHPFAGGKEMVLPYLTRLGIPAATARRMVYGDLKDTPHPSLPGGATCRLLMEKLGAFLPRELGPEWTIGVELKLARIADPSARLIVESVVYEADEVKSAGGVIIRVTRPDFDSPQGHETDAAQAEIQADVELVNDGGVEDLLKKVDELFGLQPVALAA